MPEEIRVVADGVEGIHVHLNCEGHQERGQVKHHRSQSDAPWEKGEEIKSPKRKVIRAESEETQDYVRQAKGHGSGGSGRTELRAECDPCSAKVVVSL